MKVFRQNPLSLCVLLPIFIVVDIQFYSFVVTQNVRCFSIFLNLWALLYVLIMWSILEKDPWAAERQLYFLVFGGVF